MTPEQLKTANNTIPENNNSFIPAIRECEKFISFLNVRFSLKLPSNYVVTLNKASNRTIGYFMSDKCEDRFTNTKQDLNNINLNTLHLKTSNPYEVLAHELAHFVSHIKGVKDTTSNGYHNKKFKEQAEKFKLLVEKGNKGYNQTSETEDFNKLVEEFKPSKEVFNIFQNQKGKKKVGSRLRLYICNCGVKIRCASDELQAKCLVCNSEFCMVEK